MGKDKGMSSSIDDLESWGTTCMLGRWRVQAARGASSGPVRRQAAVRQGPLRCDVHERSGPVRRARGRAKKTGGEPESQARRLSRLGKLIRIP